MKTINFWALWIIFIGLSSIEPFLALFGGFIFGLLYAKISKKQHIALEKMKMQHQLEQNQMYIDLLIQKYRTLRQYRHDFKKHLAYIQVLAQQKEVNEIEEYIKTVYVDLQSCGLLKLTGNQTLDLLLSDKIQQARQQNIEFEIDYQPNVNLSHIAALDLCIILGNLLDNALTSANQSAERRIDCCFQQRNDYYNVIIISNSCDSEPEIIEGIPRRRRYSEQHGYGVENVINRIQKYDGHYQFVYDKRKKQFQVTLLLHSDKRQSDKG